MAALRSLLVVAVVVSVVGLCRAGTELSSVEGDVIKPAAKFALNLDAVGKWLHNNIQEDIQKKLDGSSVADKDLSVSGLTLQLRNVRLDSFEEKDLNMNVENESIRAIESFRAVGHASTNLCVKKSGGDCLTVLDCKGDPTFVMDGELNSLITVASKDARPDVEVLEMTVTVKQFEIHNLGGKCHVLEDYFETDEVQDLITSNTPTVLKSVNLAIDAALDATPKVLPVNEFMSVDWSIAGDITLGGGNEGLRVASKAQLLRADGSEVVVAEPDVPFIDPVDGSPFTLALHESVPSAALAVYHEKKLLRATLKETEVMKLRLSIEAETNAAPVVTFENGDINLTAEMLLDVQGNGHEMVGVVMRASTKLVAEVDKDERSAPALFMHLNSVDVSKMDLQFDFGKIRPALHLPIKTAMKMLIKMLLPKIDKKMRASPIRLPEVAGMSMTKGQITSGEKYLSIMGGFGKIHHE